MTEIADRENHTLSFTSSSRTTKFEEREQLGFILKEDGGVILKEDGFGLLRE